MPEPDTPSSQSSSPAFHAHSLIHRCDHFPGGEAVSPTMTWSDPSTPCQSKHLPLNSVPPTCCAKSATAPCEERHDFPKVADANLQRPTSASARAWRKGRMVESQPAMADLQSWLLKEPPQRRQADKKRHRWMMKGNEGPKIKMKGKLWLKKPTKLARKREKQRMLVREYNVYVANVWRCLQKRLSHPFKFHIQPKFRQAHFPYWLNVKMAFQKPSVFPMLSE